jgi:hypothetical protein
VAAENEMRVSDTEREAAATELREHFASGRLNSDELDERLTAAFAAKTRGDLNALFADLPSSQREWAGPSTPSGTRPGPGGFGPGPFGGAPFGGAPFGARSGDWGGRAPAASVGAEADQQARGSDWQDSNWRASRGRGFGRFATTAVLIWALFLLGILGVFGIGTGRPLGIVLIVAAFALLRRLVFIFTRRGRGRGRGPGRGRGGPHRRR